MILVDPVRAVNHERENLLMVDTPPMIGHLPCPWLGHFDMKFGYVRTFGDEPVEAQQRALHDVGAEAIFVDANVAPSTVFKVNFEAMLRQAKPGDEIVVTRLDRLAKRTGPPCQRR